MRAVRSAATTLTNALDGLGIFYAVIFVAEAAIKLYAMYPAAYFSDRWNCFDFFCVATTLIGYMAGTGGGASVLRMLRIARVFRLVRNLKGLLMLLQHSDHVSAGLINIGALLFLLCFVYAVLGMNLFGKVKFGENLNEDANFTNFGNSILILLRMVTGEAWNAIMYDCMISEDCDTSVDCARGECCGSARRARVLHHLRHLRELHHAQPAHRGRAGQLQQQQEGGGRQVTEENINAFAVAWSKIDPRATGFIPVTPGSCRSSSSPAPPLGVKGTKSRARTPPVPEEP